MNKKLVLVLLLICFTAVASLSADIGLGIKGIVGTSSRTGDGWDATLSSSDLNNELALSYGGGVYLHVGIFKFLSIQPEALYSSYAYKYSDSDDDWVQHRLDFFEFPVYAQIHFGSFVLQAGPNFTYSTGTVKFLDSDGNTGSYDYDDLYDDPFAIGIAAGLGFVGDHTQFGIVYKRALTEIQSDTDIYLQSLNLELGFNF